MTRLEAIDPKERLMIKIKNKQNENFSSFISENVNQVVSSTSCHWMERFGEWMEVCWNSRNEE